MSLKYCPKCSTEKPVEHFGVNVRRSDGRQSQCKDCRNAKQREWYSDEENKALQDARNMAARRLYKQRMRARILEYFASHPCIDCGNSDPRVLQFDHVDPKFKESSISNLIGNQAAWGRIEKEIHKCEVRCANCHIIRTGAQFEWYSYMPV